MKVVGLSLVVAVVAWGWSVWRYETGRHEVSIIDATVEGRSLHLTLSACNLSDYKQDVAEGDASVTIAMTATGRNHDDCADGATVELSEPLGDRSLVDGSNGEVVPTEPPP